MTIQDAVELCLTEKNLFARPTFWKNTGQAVDIARTLEGNSTRRITPIGTSHNLRGTCWDAHPSDLTSEWEVITAQQLLEEVRGSEEEDE